jgi:hypothetical protein
MEKEFFCNVEEIKQLKALCDNISGLEMNYPVYFDCYYSIQFIYHENDLEYTFIVAPIISISNEKVRHYRLYDKESLLRKDLIAYGDRDNFPFAEYYLLDGGLFFPKEVTYDEVVKAMLNIDMEDAYDPNKIFWKKPCK